MNRLGWSCVGLGGLTLSFFHQRRLHCLTNNTHEHANVSDIPSEASKDKIFTREQVSQHKSMADGVWVTYEGGVYDITSFVEGHPGGKRILMAAGGPVEPFWRVYSIHQKDEVRNILEQYRIGSLTPDAMKQDNNNETREVNVEDPFSGDPERSPLLIVRSKKPFNAETPPALLSDFITPTDLFYVRHHLPVPAVNADTFQLKVNVLGQSFALTLDELKTKFKPIDLMATLQCAGNRRSEMNVAGKVQGLAWDKGAIGNATWRGVRLYDVLQHFGVTADSVMNDSSIRHVQFDGLDGYGASVPIETALNPMSDILLVYEMNGDVIPLDHGFPLRVLIPGHVAARSVKWVGSISLSEEESESHWQRNDYKSFSPSANWDALNWSSADAIQEMPVQSAILSPELNEIVDRKEVIENDCLEISGYAWSGGGRGISRVDVSTDGGKTWHVADLEKPDQRRNRVWAWTKWSLSLPASAILPPSSNTTESEKSVSNSEGRKKLDIICKATDTSYNTQPDSFEGIYNRRGVLSNAWHRIVVFVE